MEPIGGLAEYASMALEAAGIITIVGGAVVTLVTAIVLLQRRTEALRVYRTCRGRMGRGILIGLELLVAADIINTVAVQPTFRSVGVLAVIVLIRTFLSLTLEVEMNGRWPWQAPSDG
jgi:uncharacterized membrane protein